MRRQILQNRHKNLQQNISLTLFILYSLSINIVTAEEVKALKFTTLEGTPVQKISESVVREAYNRMGISISIKQLPGRRAIAMANAGTFDGEVSRIANIEKKFTSLIPIKIPINFIEGMVLSKDNPIHIDNWESIKHYKIAIRRGVLFSKKGTEGMNVQVLNNWKSMLRALDTGRADVIIMPRTVALKTLNDGKSPNVIINEPPIVILPLYHYLHKKRSSLIPQLESTLKKMQTDGTINRIINETRTKLTVKK